MGFEDIAADRINRICSALGSEATFIPAAGDPITLPVIKRDAPGVSPAGLEFRAPEFRTLIKCAVGDIGRQAVLGEFFLIGTDSYVIRGIDPFETTDFMGSYYVEKIS